MNQMNINQEESACTREWKSSISSLDMIVFDGSFGSYALRQLIADHINYNKDVYIDNIEGDFSKYVEKN